MQSRFHFNYLQVLAEGSIFSASELKSLSALSGVKKNDSTFLRKCVEMLYKDDLSVLKMKSVKGVECKQENTAQIRKFPISPEKMNAINEKFKQRITRSGDAIGIDEFSNRLSPANINQLLARAIYNINKKMSVKSEVKVAVVEIELAEGEDEIEVFEGEAQYEEEIDANGIAGGSADVNLDII